MSKRRFPLGDAETVRFRIHCGIEILGAIQDAMQDGPQDASTYIDAVYGVYDYLSTLNGELEECINACFEEKKEEAAIKQKEEQVA